MAIWQVWFLITVVKGVVITLLFPLWGWAVFVVGLPLVAVSIALVVFYILKDRRRAVEARAQTRPQARPHAPWVESIPPQLPPVRRADRAS